MSTPADALRQYLINQTALVQAHDPSSPSPSTSWNSVVGSLPPGPDYPDQYVAIMDMGARLFATDMRANETGQHPNVLFNIRANNYLDAFRKGISLEKFMRQIGREPSVGGVGIANVMTEDGESWIIRSVGLATPTTFVGLEEINDRHVFSINVRLDCEALSITMNLIATPGANGSRTINLGWTAPGVAVQSYSVYRSITSGQEVLVASGIGVPSYADIHLPLVKTRYYYKVSYTANGVESGLSAEASAISPPSVTTTYLLAEGDAETIYNPSIVGHDVTQIRIYAGGGDGAVSATNTFGQPYQGGGGGGFACGRPTNRPTSLLINLVGNGMMFTPDNPSRKKTRVSWNNGDDYIRAAAGANGAPGTGNPAENGTGGYGEASGHVADLVFHFGGDGQASTVGTEQVAVGGGGAGRLDNGSPNGQGGSPDGGNGSTSITSPAQIGGGGCGDPTAPTLGGSDRVEIDLSVALP